jgi:glycosyltransferase involved in cell wall biosynthesis
VKICFDNEIFWNQKFGGISSRYFFNLIKILSNNKNLDIKVFAKYYLNKKLDDLSKDIVIGKRVKFKPPFMGKIFLKLNAFFLNNEIKKFQPEIIHKTYYSNFLKKNKKSKVILTVFDLWHEKNSKILHRPKEYSVKISDHIICPSISTKNDLSEIYNIDKKKITVTYFGAEQFENLNVKKEIKDYVKPFLLFVGARGRYKNFNNFVEAYSKSKKLYKDFDIVCFGGEEFSADEINFFKKLGIINSIKKERDSDDQTLLTLYKQAKCLVYPSAHEGLGLPPIEAMSLGCPAITSNHPAIMEGVGKASASFDPNDVLKIKQVLEEYLYSDDKLKKLIDLGFIQSQKFSWNRCVAETLDVYKKVLD